MIRTSSLFLFSFLCFSFLEARVLDRIAVVIDKKPVLLSEVLALQKAEGLTSYEEALDQLIDRQVLHIELASLGLEVGEKELDGAVSAVIKQNGLDQDSFAKALKSQGLTPERHRAQLFSNMQKMKLIQAKVKSRVQVADADLKLAYQAQYGEESKTAYKVVTDYLLIPGKSIQAEKTARNACDKLAKAKNKVATAKKIADGKKIKFGSFSEVSRGVLLAEFEKPIFSLPVGSVSDPIKSEHGFFVLLIVGHVKEDKVPFENVRHALHAKLFEMEVDKEYRRYIDEVRSKIFIDIKKDANQKD